VSLRRTSLSSSTDSLLGNHSSILILILLTFAPFISPLSPRSAATSFLRFCPNPRTLIWCGSGPLCRSLSLKGTLKKHSLHSNLWSCPGMVTNHPLSRPSRQPKPGWTNHPSTHPPTNPHVGPPWWTHTDRSSTAARMYWRACVSCHLVEAHRACAS
jgi:hypothetical protein